MTGFVCLLAYCTVRTYVQYVHIQSLPSKSEISALSTSKKHHVASCSDAITGSTNSGSSKSVRGRPGGLLRRSGCWSCFHSYFHLQQYGNHGAEGSFPAERSARPKCQHCIDGDEAPEQSGEGATIDQCQTASSVQVRNSTDTK